MNELTIVENVTTDVMPTASNGMNRSGVHTDGQLIALWLRSKRSENTRKAYQRSIEQFMELIENKPLGRISVTDLESFVAQLQDDGKSERTINLKLNSIKSLLTYATKLGYIQFNVGNVVKALEVEKTMAGKFLTEEQMYKLFDGATDPTTHCMVYVLYYSAIRASELVNLKWKHFTQNGDNWQLDVTRSKSNPRVIVLHPKAADCLLERKTEDCEDDHYIFPGKDETSHTDPTVRQHPNSVYMTLHRLGERVGFKVTPHMLRHSHATHYIQRSGDILTLKETLGHSNIAVTNSYLHANPKTSSSLGLA